MTQGRGHLSWPIRVGALLLAFMTAALARCGGLTPRYRESGFYDSAVNLSFRYASMFDRIASNTDAVRRDLLA
jgi:hypothetical protein